MQDQKQAHQTDLRQALDALAQAWADHRRLHPDEAPDVWFTELRRLVEARAVSLQQVEALGAMGGGGADEA